MINKAISLDKKNRYYCSNLLEWMPKKPVDLVHSMEVFYYFKKPKKIIEHIYKNWRETNQGDFYENQISHGGLMKLM